jgi:hypothetical protein
MINEKISAASVSLQLEIMRHDRALFSKKDAVERK